MTRAPQVISTGKNAHANRGRLAGELALSGSWAEAAEVNREITSENPEDVEAYNRLGKALKEIGAVQEAIEAFEKTLAIAPRNPIAVKNLDRLVSQKTARSRQGRIRKSPRGQGTSGRATVTAEAGKSGLVPLINVTSLDALDDITAGDSLEMISDGRVVKAFTTDGTHIGQIEPRAGARISKLMDGGNTYEAFMKDFDAEGKVTLLIRETYQHPSQIGIISFPSPQTTFSIDANANRYISFSTLPQEIADKEMSRMAMLKDWTEDDTEPGDDEAFAPGGVQRIIDSAGKPEEDF